MVKVRGGVSTPLVQDALLGEEHGRVCGRVCAAGSAQHPRRSAHVHPLHPRHQTPATLSLPPGTCLPASNT